MSKLFEECFCNNVAKSRKVWTLRKSGRFVAPTNPVTGEKGMPFWTSLTQVENAIEEVPGFEGCEPLGLSWQSFVEEWVPRLTAEKTPVGLAWGGFEAMGGCLEAVALVEAVTKQIELDRIYDLVQNEFNYLNGKIGQNGRRKISIIRVPKIGRDLYLVHDIVAITNNAGMMAWIHYHHEEEGWIDCARDAFSRIGHPQVSDDLKYGLEIYLKNRDSLKQTDGRETSRYIWDHENEIMHSLYSYLVAAGFTFPHSGT